MGPSTDQPDTTEHGVQRRPATPAPRATRIRPARPASGAALRPQVGPSVDLTALARVRLASLLGLLSSAVSAMILVTLFTLPGEVTSSSGASSSGLSSSGGVTLHFSSLGTAGLIASLGLVPVLIGIVVVLLFLFALGELSRASATFRMPARFAVVALGGLAVVVVGLLLLQVGLAQEGSCSLSWSLYHNPCLSQAAAWVGAVLAGVGLFPAVAGILGIEVGVWRLGVRYAVPMLKVGAVLLVVPFASIAGYLLVLLASHRQIARL